MIRRTLLALPAVLIATYAGADPPSDGGAKNVHEYNRLLGRGINLGNMLEAPREGEWGVKLKEEYFEAVRRAGFQSVRIPIRWTTHASLQAPYEIEPEFFARVDWAVEQALSRDLVAIINVHHYEELDREPEKHAPRLTALWRQIGERYRAKSDRLFFELLNEPHDKLTDEKWNAVLPEVLRVVRESNPRRAVVVGPGNWNSASHLDRLQLPAQDRFLIVTFHYYNPFHFTHQGAPWVAESEKWKGETWTGTPAQVKAIRDDFAKAAAWSKKHDRPLFLGEFGAFSGAKMDSRAKWTRAVVTEAERLGTSHAYWEFASGFGAYDPVANQWRTPLLKALMPEKRR